MSSKVPPRLLPPIGLVHVPLGATPAKAPPRPTGVRRRPRAGEWHPEERPAGEGAGADAFEGPDREPREEAASSAAQRRAGGGDGQAALAAPVARAPAPAVGERRASGVPPLPTFAAGPDAGAATSGARPRRAHADLDALARAVLARFEQAPAERRAQVEALLRRLP